MATKYGTDKTTILKYARSIGYDTNANHPPVLTEEQKEFVKTNYNNFTSTELSKRLNVSRSTILKVWMDSGLIGKVGRIYQYNENYFESIDSPNKAYWLGFLASDGCIAHHDKDNRQDSIRLNLQSCDCEILEKLNKELKTTKPIVYYTRKSDGGKYVGVEFSSNKMSSDLQKYNLGYRKTYDYIFPDMIEEKYYRDFIRGFFDGDGCISHSFDINTLYKVNVSISGFFKNLSRIQEILAQNGIEAVFTEDKREYGDCKDKFGALTFRNKKEKMKFLQYIYFPSELHLERKYSLAKKFIELVPQSKAGWTTKKER